MFIGDETTECHKRDNFPKDQTILSLVLPSLDGLLLDMMVRVKECCTQHAVAVTIVLLTVKSDLKYIDTAYPNLTQTSTHRSSCQYEQ